MSEFKMFEGVKVPSGEEGSWRYEKDKVEHDSGTSGNMPMSKAKQSNQNDAEKVRSCGDYPGGGEA